MIERQPHQGWVTRRRGNGKRSLALDRRGRAALCCGVLPQTAKGPGVSDISHDTDFYVTLVENAYFASVGREDIAAALDCFTPDAKVTIYHGDAPARRFAVEPGAGESPLREFYDHLLANYVASFSGFRHFVDVPGERCAATFDVTLAPKPGSAYLDAGTRRLKNCNFFHCRDGKIFDMIIYYADPGADAGAPTGFPKSA